MLNCVSTILMRACRTAQLPRQAVAAVVASSNVPAAAASIIQHRKFTSIKDDPLARHAFERSCYASIDFTIDEEATVYEAVQRFSAFNIGCLVTKNAEGKTSGVISERDVLTKIALLGRTSKDTKIKEVSTKTANLVTASPHDPVETCMQKMLTTDIRHLPLLDDDDKVIGMLSIKDLVKVAVAEREKTIQTLSNFALGKGGHFIED